MTKDEALKLALELLESAHVATDLVWKRHDAVEAIKEALAEPEFVLNGIDCSCGRKWRVVNNTLTASEQPEQESDDLTIAYMAGLYDGKNKDAPQRKPEQEPVANGIIRTLVSIDKDGIETWKHEPFYTAPPERKPLTDEQINKMIAANLETWNSKSAMASFVRAIEAAHGIKGE